MSDIALKPSRYFCLLMEKPLGRYFQVRSSYYQAAQCNQKTPISCILKVTCKVWESPKISPKVLSHPDDQSFTRFGCCVFMTKLAFNFFNELCFNYQSQWTIVNFDITRHWNFSHFRMEFSSNTKFVFLFLLIWLLIFLYFCEKWR